MIHSHINPYGSFRLDLKQHDEQVPERSRTNSATFNLNTSACSSGCSVLPAGTVDLTQNGLNNVLVTVQLTNDYSFRRAPDGNHHAFAFNSNGVSGVTATGISSGPTAQTFTFSGTGSYRDAGLGSFTYAFECSTCAVGATSTPTQNLTFGLMGTGLMVSSFVSNGTKFFGVDVVGLDQTAGVGLTGNIGATDPGNAGNITSAGTFFARSARNRVGWPCRCRSSSPDTINLMCRPIWRLCTKI